MLIEQPRRVLKRKGSFVQTVAKKPRLTRGGTLILPSSKVQRLSHFSMNQGTHGVELKDIDTDVSSATFDTTGSILLINGVAQGSDFTNRVGRKFTMTSIYCRLVIQNGSAQVSNQIARWLVVYDKQANSGTPAITDVLTAVSTTAPNNLNNRERFVIVYDKWYNIGGTGANDNSRLCDKKYRKTNLETVNSGTGSTVTSIQSGALYFITVGDVAAGTTTPKMLGGTIRVRFSDD